MRIKRKRPGFRPGPSQSLGTLGDLAGRTIANLYNAPPQRLIHLRDELDAAVATA